MCPGAFSVLICYYVKQQLRMILGFLGDVCHQETAQVFLYNNEQLGNIR